MPIGQHRDLFTEAGAVDREHHFGGAAAHARTAAHTRTAHHDDVTGLDATAQ